ncbi:RHS repeat-associated core domain-containing protein [Chryseolinea soli]|uniref:RHS repeat-associated core domain-containing protein n=1 Tax=Chryseolinea soli TaxID=2321403 RepID=UPI003AAD8553
MKVEAYGGTEQNTTTGLYDLAYRNFDPALGRFHQADPLADKYSSLSPYNFAYNDPVSYNHPAGLEVGSQGGCSCACLIPT